MRTRRAKYKIKIGTKRFKISKNVEGRSLHITEINGKIKQQYSKIIFRLT